ncbi:hypothetical protein TIFTF001_039268 [Ficus carica]|uniref:Uncharacterized protein n=1 Tax=Ficus carica TaxID=3494 RepID=A0AA88E9I8_FICCA|nr:hypothetical protein TIFTF001_039268 [Ficus carica]
MATTTSFTSRAPPSSSLTPSAIPIEPWQCPSHISQSAEPALHSIASEIASRLLTYSIDVRRELSLGYLLFYYVLRNAAPLPGTAVGFLLLDEGYR